MKQKTGVTTTASHHTNQTTAAGHSLSTRVPPLDRLPAQHDDAAPLSCGDNRLSTVTAALFSQWQQLTRQANLALLQQQPGVAHQHYQQALQQAEQLQALDPCQDAHLAAFVISLHNQADLALLENQPGQARELLRRAYQQLWSLCRQHALNAAICHLVLPHLQLCRRELAFFCQNFGPDPVSQQLLAEPWPGALPS